MAEDAAGRAGWHVTLEDVQIGAADRRFADFNDSVAGSLDLWFGVIFEGLLSRAMINESLHRSSSDISVCSFLCDPAAPSYPQPAIDLRYPAVIIVVLQDKERGTGDFVRPCKSSQRDG